MKGVLRSILVSIVLTFLIAQINYRNMYAGTISSYYIFCVGVWLCLCYHYLKRKNAFLTIPVTLMIAHFIVHIIDQYASADPSDRSNIISTFLTQPGIFMLPGSILGSITAGLLSGNRRSKIWAAILFCVMSIMFVFKSRQWFDQWLFYLSFDTLDGKVQERVPDWKAVTEGGVIIGQHSFKDKILVLDFWNTSCGVCFRKFPLLDSVSKVYKSDTNIVFYAVNIPLDGDTEGLAFEMIRKKGYSFNVAIGDTTIPAKLGFNVYPTTFIIQDDSIQYRGNIEKAIQHIATVKK